MRGCIGCVQLILRIESNMISLLKTLLHIVPVLLLCSVMAACTPANHADNAFSINYPSTHGVTSSNLSDYEF